MHDSSCFRFTLFFERNFRPGFKPL